MKKFLLILFSVFTIGNLYAKNKYSINVESGITKDKEIKAIGGFEFQHNLFVLMINGGADFNFQQDTIKYPLSLKLGCYFLKQESKFNFNLNVGVKDYIFDWEKISALANLNFKYNFTELFSIKIGATIGYQFTKNLTNDNFWYEGNIGISFSFAPKDNTIEKRRKDDDIYFMNEKTQSVNEIKEKTKIDDNHITLTQEEYDLLLLAKSDEEKIKELKNKLEEEFKETRSAKEIIDDNNRASRVSVIGNENYNGAICHYIYSREKVFDIFCTPRTNTDVRLKDTEKVLEIKLGDDINWSCETIENNENGKSYQHILFRPNNVKIKTEGAIYTTERTYFINLISFEKEYQVRLEFVYPKNEKNNTTGEQNSITKTLDNVENLIFNYKIVGNAYWKPNKVYSDSLRTYIQFSNSFNKNSTAPSVYIRNIKTGEEYYQNILVNKITYILPVIISADEEILLKNENEIVRIERNL